MHAYRHRVLAIAGQRLGWTPSCGSSTPFRRSWRCIQTDTDRHGQKTLAHVVRELRAQGRLPTKDATGSGQPEFMDLDEALAREADAWGGSSGGEVVEVEDLLRDGAPGVGTHGAYGAPHGFFDRGELGFDEEEAMEAEEDEEDEGSVALRYSNRAPEEIEDVTKLTEEELRERVQKSIEQLVPGTNHDRGDEQTMQDTTGLTPAQIFYMENRDRLVGRAQDYYLEKQRELKAMQEKNVLLEVEDEWRYYHEPVVRPAKGFLWSTGEEQEGDGHGYEQGWIDVIEDWPRGQVPSVDMLADLLRREQARDIEIVDLGKCDRRDLGTHAILATGVTPQHCRRLGEVTAKATERCKPPHVEAFCYGTRRDEWVVSHCGPIKVHIFTRDTREEYQLQKLWETPDLFFEPDDFPHYLEIYGTATQASFLPDGHVTEPTGSRSTTAIPPPFRDTVHTTLTRADYDAAEDTRYTTQTMNLGGREDYSDDEEDPFADLESSGVGGRPTASRAAPVTEAPHGQYQPRIGGDYDDEEMDYEDVRERRPRLSAIREDFYDDDLDEQKKETDRLDIPEGAPRRPPLRLKRVARDDDDEIIEVGPKVASNLESEFLHEDFDYSKVPVVSEADLSLENDGDPSRERRASGGRGAGRRGRKRPEGEQLPKDEDGPLNKL